MSEVPHRTPDTVTAEREAACWSNNAAVGYSAALNRCKGHLTDALELLEGNQIPQAEIAMKAAARCMNEANIWFNQANNAHFRTQALVAEVKALRSGVGVSHAAGNDPVDDNWRVPL